MTAASTVGTKLIKAKNNIKTAHTMFFIYRIRYVKSKLQSHYTNSGTSIQLSLQNLKINKHNRYWPVLFIKHFFRPLFLLPSTVSLQCISPF
ncbi:hypothetical protein STZ1_11087 [Bacillus subtilis]